MDFQEYCRQIDLKEKSLAEVRNEFKEMEGDLDGDETSSAKKFDAFFSTQLRHTEKMAELTNEFIQHSKRVLDVGCGTCTPTLWMALQNPDKDFYALDKSPLMLKEAKEKKQNLVNRGLKIDNVELILADKYSIPFENEIFDTVYQCRPQFTDEPSFLEMCRVLKGNGLMLTLKVLKKETYEENYKQIKKGKWVDNDYVPRDWGSFEKRVMRIFEIDGDGLENRVIAYMRLKTNTSLSRSARRYSLASSGSA